MKVVNWLRERLKHKLHHFSWNSIKTTLKEHGLALVIIIVGWEIVEDIIFPIIFGLMGQFIHPAFFAGIPASLIICLHWFMVPLLWGMWIKISGENKEVKHECGGCDNE